jgi:triosephosphate isomerase
MIFVNFKTYEQGTGGSGVALAKILEEVATESQIKIIPVVQASDILEVVQSVKLEVWSQHIDPIDYGAHTGAILPESIKEDGATGTFLNHSEHKFEKFEDLEKAHKRASELNLKTLIFAGDLKELEKVVKLEPVYVSYEPPELVGSKTTSVAKAKPDIIAKAVEIAKAHDLPLIVGAGIKSTEDVRKSIELGAVGVAVASDIVASNDPKKELEELVAGFE